MSVCFCRFSGFLEKSFFERKSEGFAPFFDAKADLIRLILLIYVISFQMRENQG